MKTTARRRSFGIFIPTDKIWLPPNADADLSLKAPHLRATRTWFNNPAGMLFEPKTYQALRNRKQHGYLGCVSQVDHAVGELLDFLSEKGLTKNTIVLYTSDHGDYGCEFGVLEKAPGICGDAICRVPRLWRWPGHFRAGYVSDRITEAVDVAPTLCSLAGLPPMPTADGEDIGSLLRGEDREIHKIGVTEHPWSKAVLKGQWRLVYYPKGFFNDKNEAQEFGELLRFSERPLGNEESLPSILNTMRKFAELQRDLLDWLVTTTRVKTVLPAYFLLVESRAQPGANPDFFPHEESDGKLPWREREGGCRQRNYK